MPAASAERIQLELRAEARYQQSLRRARVDLATFTELAAHDESGNPFVLDWIHLTWIFHVDYSWSRGKHALIMAPFGSGKSSCFVVPFAAWLVGTDPQRRIKIVSNGDDFAKQRVAAVKDLIDSSPYREVFPAVRRGDKWSDHELEVSRLGNAIDPSVHARGVMTKGIGGRADNILFDDICDQLNSEEPGARRKIKTFARKTWMSRLDGMAARAAMVATPWHPDDATHDFWSDPTWCTLRQPVSKDKEAYEQEVFNAGTDYGALQQAFLAAHARNM